MVLQERSSGGRSWRGFDEFNVCFSNGVPAMKRAGIRAAKIRGDSDRASERRGNAEELDRGAKQD
jgi:hypothetical protein